MKIFTLAVLVVTLLLAGCGGGGDSGPGEVSGIVFDLQGNPVRDAEVQVEGRRTTRTNSNGAYALELVSSGDVVVSAEVRDASEVRYLGQNVARVIEDERTRSLNIVVVPENEIARIRGRVMDRNGNSLRGARVFASPADQAVLSSSVALTDSDGRYTLERLRRGTAYDVIVNAQLQGSRERTITPGVDPEEQNFSLPSPDITQLVAPENVLATAYTMPAVSTRSGTMNSAYEAIRQSLPRYRKGERVQRTNLSRLTPNGNWIEIDVVWDLPAVQDILGYGVYRRENNDEAIADLVRDPYAQLYADLDARIRVGQTYTYWVTTLGTWYDSFTLTGESDFSAPSGVIPIGDLGAPQRIGNRLDWSSATGASRYTTYIFAEYPRIGQTSLFNNFASPSSESELTFPSGLVSGRRYFAIILGRNVDDSAYTFSPVTEFIAP